MELTTVSIHIAVTEMWECLNIFHCNVMKTSPFTRLSPREHSSRRGSCRVGAGRCGVTTPALLVACSGDTNRTRRDHREQSSHYFRITFILPMNKHTQHDKHTQTLRSSFAGTSWTETHAATDMSHTCDQTGKQHVKQQETGKFPITRGKKVWCFTCRDIYDSDENILLNVNRRIRLKCGGANLMFGLTKHFFEVDKTDVDKRQYSTCMQYHDSIVSKCN